jgi:phosphate:Na+ symporter
MDITSLTSLVFGIIGGLGIFLLGMKNMSDGMQAVAGSGLRRMIGAVTNHRVMATVGDVYRAVEFGDDGDGCRIR